MNNTKIKSTLLSALKRAGKTLLLSIFKRGGFSKKTELSIVTETDTLCEKIVIDIIKKDFPDHSILSEESPAISGTTSRWIIDPIDGTTNFAHTYPVSCVSIAFEKEDSVTMGGVFDPFRNELFFAEQGKGAFLNGAKISVSKTSSINDSLIATGFPYDRRERADEYLAVLKSFMMKAQGLRRSGSAALDLCYVACGRFDGFWELNLAPWDKAAAMLIISEAGGTLSDFSGNTLTLHGKQNVASNLLIQNEMLEILKPFKDLCANS